MIVNRYFGRFVGVNVFFFGVFFLGYYVVVVVKFLLDFDFIWNFLKGKKFCYIGVDRIVGWNIFMGLFYSEIKYCEFGE